MSFLKNTAEFSTDNNPSDKDDLFTSISQYSHKPEKENDVFQSLLGEASNIFHSAEDIRTFHQQSIDARADAFHQLTRLDDYLPVSSMNITGRLHCFNSHDLVGEFSSIKDNEKINVFIEELEQLISNLYELKPVFGEMPDNFQRLIEFKSSIHLIKLLSEMMQATQLKHFSQTVIEFLDDLVDGRIRLTDDIIERLSVLVNCYDYYNYSIKDNSNKRQ